MKYIPKYMYKSIFDIEYDKLSDNNIKFLLFDLDNTIAPRNIDKVNQKTIDLFDKITKEFKIIILSNSLKKRVKNIADQLNIEYISLSRKPSKYGFNKALLKYKYKKEETAIIGDQLITDIKGGNKFGITTILVSPISDYDGIFTRINRLREKRIKKSWE